jgi:AIPR protein
LIDEISAATNRQTPVTAADRVSNDSKYIALQKVLFSQYGFLYERKRGEFSDGINSGYVDRSQILERNLFLRLLLASQGSLIEARRRKIFVKHELAADQLIDSKSLELFADSYLLFNRLSPKGGGYQTKYRSLFAKIYLGLHRTDRALDIDKRAEAIEEMWAELIVEVVKNRPTFKSKGVDRTTGNVRYVFSVDKWVGSQALEADVKEFVQTGKISSTDSGSVWSDNSEENLSPFEK